MSKLSVFISIFGSELSRFYERVQAAIKEFFPQSATETIDQWENDYGIIPDDSVALDTRRKRVLAQMNATGGQSVEYFYTLAEKLGYNRYPSTEEPYIEIVEFAFLPFRVEISEIENDSIYDQDTGGSIFTWKVVGTSVTTDMALQTLFTKNKPAHTEIVFEDA